MTIGLLHSLLRKDEKLLLEAFAKVGVEPVMLDDRRLVMNLDAARFWQGNPQRIPLSRETFLGDPS